MGDANESHPPEVRRFLHLRSVVEMNRMPEGRTSHSVVDYTGEFGVVMVHRDHGSHLCLCHGSVRLRTSLSAALFSSQPFISVEY